MQALPCCPPVTTLSLRALLGIHVLVYTNSQLMLENTLFTTHHMSKVQNKGEYSGYCGYCQWMQKLGVYRAGD